MKLEICANSFESALAAQKGGAYRIELCQELSLGGITPSHGLIEKVLEEIDSTVFVLIRPRSGDFTYTKSEFDVMLRDIAFAKAKGAQGIVSGVLYTDGTIDIERTKQLIVASGSLSFTFHRAFDWTPNAIEAMEHLIDLGVQRVLTSGQATNAVAGFALLKKLHKLAKNRIGILPGAGISKMNITKFKNAGFSEVHGSVSHIVVGQTHDIKMSESETINSGVITVSHEESIRELVKQIQECG